MTRSDSKDIKKQGHLVFFFFRNIPPTWKTAELQPSPLWLGWTVRLPACSMFTLTTFGPASSTATTRPRGSVSWTTVQSFQPRQSATVSILTGRPLLLLRGVMFRKTLRYVHYLIELYFLMQYGETIFWNTAPSLEGPVWWILYIQRGPSYQWYVLVNYKFGNKE